MKQLNGIIVLNKSAGMTSHDCVSKIRRLAKTKKVGHTGTLDPNVTGVLPLCIGQATRVAEYLLDYEKEYTATITLGKSTTTEDQWGETIEEVRVEFPPSEEELRIALDAFTGKVKQIPPMYSAVKQNGKRLHELAREGKVVERKAREVEIYDMKLLQYDAIPPNPSFKIQVRCSKGTYIRTLGVDIGKHLGYPAHLHSLIRSKSGPFRLEDTVTLEEIAAWTEEDWQQKLFSIDSALIHLPKLILSPAEEEKVRVGQSLYMEEVLQKDMLYRIYTAQDHFLALYTAISEHQLKPRKVFLG